MTTKKMDEKTPIFIDSNEPLELPVFVTRESVSLAKPDEPLGRMLTLEGRNQWYDEQGIPTHMAYLKS